MDLEWLPKDSWFRKWMKLWPLAEPPKSYILFSGMAMLGACLGRKLWLDMDVHQVRPMLNLLLIGPSGVGKSTSVKMAKRLLNYVPEAERPQFFEGGSTKEKLHRDLVHQPKAVLFAPELAAFFSREKYKESLIPYVTQLLDYEEVLELRTIKDNVVRVKEPTVTIIGGSTVDWLQGQLPDSAVSGGFLARFLIMYEEEKGDRQPNPQRKLGRAKVREVADAREAAFQEFAELVSVHSGPMDYEDSPAAEVYANWYMAQKIDRGYLAPFEARAGEMILRLAMILAISGRRNELSEEDIKCAIKLYEYIFSKLSAVVVPPTAQGKLTNLVLTNLGEDTGAPEDVMSTLKFQVTQADLEKVLETLFYNRKIPDYFGLEDE